MSSNQSFETPAELRNRLLNSMLFGTAVVASPAVAISVWRMATLGWKPLLALHIGMMGVLWTLWLMRAAIPYAARATGLLAIYWVTGVAGYLQLGPAAVGGVFLLLFVFSGMLFLSQRAGWWLAAFATLCIAAVGYAATQHWLVFNVDYQVYAYHPSSWLLIVWTLSAFSILLAYVAWAMVHGVRKQDEATQELAARLKKIGANIPGVVYQYLLRADGTSCFPYASEGIRDIYGVSPESVREDASAVFAVLHPDDIGHVVRTIQDSSRDLKDWQAVYRVNHPSRGVIWVEGRATPERQKNGDIIWHGFISDITERKKAELIKDEFVATVSHELRTPLTSIRGSLGLLFGGMAGALSVEARSLSDIALRNSERLGKLIDDLLDIEKISSGKTALEIRPQPLMPCVEHALVANKGFADVYGVTFELFGRADDVTVSIDRGRFQQVLSNFLSNAAKYSPANGRVEVDVAVHGDVVRVNITDHGAGVPEEFRPHVFKKFSQADASDSRTRPGTGLGLAITKELVDRMHGRVGFESVANVSTTFWVELPVLRTKE